MADQVRSGLTPVDLGKDPHILVSVRHPNITIAADVLNQPNITVNLPGGIVLPLDQFIHCAGETLFGQRSVAASHGHHVVNSSLDGSPRYLEVVVIESATPFTLKNETVTKGASKGSLQLTAEPDPYSHQMFPLLDLPEEMQVMIFRECLHGEDKVINVDERAKKKRDGELLSQEFLCGQLLAVNKEVRAKTLPILYGENTFRFKTTLSASHFMRKSLGYESKFGKDFCAHQAKTLTIPIRKIEITGKLWNVSGGWQLASLMRTAPRVDHCAVTADIWNQFGADVMDFVTDRFDPVEAIDIVKVLPWVLSAREQRLVDAGEEIAPRCPTKLEVAKAVLDVYFRGRRGRTMAPQYHELWLSLS